MLLTCQKTVPGLGQEDGKPKEEGGGIKAVPSRAPCLPLHLLSSDNRRYVSKLTDAGRHEPGLLQPAYRQALTDSVGTVIAYIYTPNACMLPTAEEQLSVAIDPGGVPICA